MKYLTGRGIFQLEHMESLKTLADEIFNRLCIHANVPQSRPGLSRMSEQIMPGIIQGPR